MTEILTPSGSQAQSAGSRPAWGKLWQVPMLLLGLAAFGFACRELILHRNYVPFSTYVSDLHGLLAHGQYEAAIKQVDVLAERFHEPLQQGELESIQGDAYYLAQRQQPVMVEENYQNAITHYEKAERWGFKPGADINEHWGMAAYEMGDYKKAVEKLELALAARQNQIGDMVRPLVWSYLNLEKPKKDKAVELLEKFVASNPPVAAKVWGITRRLELLIGAPGLDGALAEAKQQVLAIKEPAAKGLLLSWIGRIEYEKGHLDEAEKFLAESRKNFAIHNQDDGRSLLLLGKIAQARGRIDEAAADYHEVILSHAGTSLFAAARLGRAEMATFAGPVDDGMREDFHYAIQALTPNPRAKERPELITPDVVRGALIAAEGRYEQQGDFTNALVMLGLQRDMHEPETAEFAYRQAEVEEKLGDQILAGISGEKDEAIRGREQAEAFRHYAAAGEDFLRHARLTVSDAQISSASLWRAAALFDKSGRTERAIVALTRFGTDFPSDPRMAEALNMTGVLQESMGNYDKALVSFLRNVRENPNSPPAYVSKLHIARCYMALGAANYPKAEAALLSVVQNNPNILPVAKEFRASLFTLGELYYRTGRWADAILRLEEALLRYPADPAASQARYWLADSYRRSAQDIGDALAAGTVTDQKNMLEAARKTRLAKAQELFNQVIESTDTGEADTETLPPVTRDYLRYSFLYRGDCAYERGEYQEAVKLYDAVVTRYSQSVTAIEAYVQIINAYGKMQSPAQAAAAAERAQWILKRVPEKEFGAPPLNLSRDYYQKLLALAQGNP